ncbi:MAG TPA: YkgJ family cysteine cluster protein [Candidatus Thermoplasmatota archaeon]|nr:YkgJ family cysteine cluster protein [Candidatus Thermoplasmatota archaeon]
MNLEELTGRAYSCIPGCGFCCTFPAAVSTAERRQLQAAGAGQAVAARNGVLSLKLQGGCGACTLLNKDRQCSVYDARPNPCRYFPFHVYFGRRTEVYVNYTCRGVILAPLGNLHAAYADSVTANVDARELAAREAEARETHRQFQQLCREAGIWEDPDPVVDALLMQGPDLFTAKGVTALARIAKDDAPLEEHLQAALEAWAARNPTHRPYYLDPATRWLTYAPEGDGLRVQELHDDGRLTSLHLIEGLTRWEEPPVLVQEALFRYLERLARRDLFVGSAFALVDEDGYRARLREALASRLAEIVVDLVVRSRLIAPTLARELSAEEVADEVARFYDGDFLDSPTIGGFL